MKEFQAAVFQSISQTLALVAAQAEERQWLLQSRGKTDVPVPENLRFSLAEALIPLLDYCSALGLPASAKSTDRLLAAAKKDECQFATVRNLIVELQGRLVDEMQGRLFLSLSLAEGQHYRSYWEGWREVLYRFPNTMTDVEEARKCLALGRYTAAVFHLMRVTEAAVLELQCFLDTGPDHKAHFGSVVAKLEHLRQKTDFKNLPDHLKPYVGFLTDVLPQLHAVKDSWRNRVSHIDDRVIIADVFTEEMALGIHDATLLLMKKLASGLPERDDATEGK